MKVNSKDLWEYVNNRANKRIYFKVFYDDNYATAIMWNGANFVWEPGQLNSEAFFNPLYDFEPLEIKTTQNKEIKIIDNAYYHETQDRINEIFKNKINDIIDKINNME